ncbi:MAG: PAS domain S-box protein [Rhodocyclaceae bacterium]
MSSDRCDQVKGEASEHFASDLKTLQNSDSSLAEPDYLFQCIFNHAWNGMVLANVEQQSFVKANPAFLRMTGYEAEELPDLHVARIHPAESLAEVMEAFRRMACGEIFLAENIPVLRRDGSTFFADINGSPFALNDTRYVLGEFRDLTDQRLAQQALAAEEITRRRLFESMRDAFAVVDMSGRIVDCNPAYCSMLGYSLAELKEKTYPELTPERWHAAEAQTIAEQVLLLGVSDIYRKEYIRKDGTVFPVELKVVLLRDDTGQPEGMWGVVRDITERKQTEADLIQARTQAEAANRAKSRFLAAASHDLRQPLMAISLFVDTLSRVSTSQQQKKLTDQMKSSVQSLGGLLDKLLNIARLDSGAIEAKLCDVRSSQLIQWIEMEFRPLFQASLDFHAPEFG